MSTWCDCMAASPVCCINLVSAVRSQNVDCAQSSPACAHFGVNDADSDKMCKCRGVSAWYEWLVNRGDKGPKYEGDTEPALFRNGMGVLDRKAMLDRTNHVRNCSSCTKVWFIGFPGQVLDSISHIPSVAHASCHVCMPRVRLLHHQLLNPDQCRAHTICCRVCQE